MSLVLPCRFVEFVDGLVAFAALGVQVGFGLSEVVRLSFAQQMSACRPGGAVQSLGRGLGAVLLPPAAGSPERRRLTVGWLGWRRVAVLLTVGAAASGSGGSPVARQAWGRAGLSPFYA
jgi:hypothetical protein